MTIAILQCVVWNCWLIIVDNCLIPNEPVNGAILNFADLKITEGSVITFQCDPGFSPAAEMTATCNSSGQWSTDPSQLVCTGCNGEWPIT